MPWEPATGQHHGRRQFNWQQTTWKNIWGNISLSFALSVNLCLRIWVLRDHSHQDTLPWWWIFTYTMWTAWMYTRDINLSAHWGAGRGQHEHGLSCTRTHTHNIVRAFSVLVCVSACEEVRNPMQELKTRIVLELKKRLDLPLQQLMFKILCLTSLLTINWHSLNLPSLILSRYKCMRMV